MITGLGCVVRNACSIPRRRSRERIARGRGIAGTALALLIGLLGASAWAGEPQAAATSLRAAAARVLADGAFTRTEPFAWRASPDDRSAGFTRQSASPPSTVDCAGALSAGLGTGLGLLAGAGLGLGLGVDAGSGSSKQLQPFGLTDSLITGAAVAISWKGYKLVGREPPSLCQGGASGCGSAEGVGRIDAAVRRALVRHSLEARATANALSNATLWASVALPIAFLLTADQAEPGRELGLMLESAAITSALLQVVKHRVNRQRPYARYCELACGHAAGERGSRLSFFSGHAALAFSAAVSAGTIASMRSYPHSGWLLGSGLALATTTGYLRIAADRHYFTDVLAGALVGATVGWAVPQLHGMLSSPPDTASAAARRRPRPSALVLPLPLGAAGRGLALHGGVGRDGARLSLSWSF
jgi:membrane-associated phospholipid phosphatase